MTHNARFIISSAILIAAAVGAELALASPVQQGQVTDKTVAATSVATRRPGTGVVVPPNLQRISALTDEECEGLGGVVSSERNCASGRVCGTSSQSGVVRYVCITKK